MHLGRGGYWHTWGDLVDGVLNGFGHSTSVRFDESKCEHIKTGSPNLDESGKMYENVGN